MTTMWSTLSSLLGRLDSSPSAGEASASPIVRQVRPARSAALDSAREVRRPPISGPLLTACRTGLPTVRAWLGPHHAAHDLHGSRTPNVHTSQRTQIDLA